ncbi:hypothetical protein [Pseudomonas sp. SDO55104_S430]
MNALAAAQSRWDNMTPADTSARDEAADNWSYNAGEQLVFGCDLVIRTRSQTKVITYADFLGKVQERLNQRQIDGEDTEDLFAQLVLMAIRTGVGKSIAQQLLGDKDPQELAMEMADPWFDLAMEQAAEDFD